MGAREDREVPAPARRRHIGVDGAHPSPAGDRHIDDSGAVLDRPVEIVVARDAGLPGGRHEGLFHRAEVRRPRGPHGTVAAVIEAVASVAPLRTAEVGQDIGVSPAFETALAPQVVIHRVAANVDHAVEAGAPAERLAARVADAASAQFRLRRAVKSPVIGGAVEQEAVGRGRPVERRDARTAGFQQQDAAVGVLAQARGQDAAGRTADDDDVVEGPALHGEVRPRGRGPNPTRARLPAGWPRPQRFA